MTAGGVLARIRAFFATKPASQTESAVLLDQARVLFQSGEFEKAIAVCQDVQRLCPDNYECMILCGEAAVKIGNFTAALQSYDRAIQSNPSQATAYYKRGNVSRDRNDLQAAIADYDRAIAIDAGYAMAFCNRGATWQRLNNLNCALADFDSAIAINQHDSVAHFNRGGVLRELWRVEEALASYDHALKIRPDFVDCLCNRGVLLAELNRHEPALASYDRCIKIAPDFAQAHFNRGAVLQVLKRRDAALFSYQRAIEIKSDYAEAYCNAGVLLTELKQWRAAHQSLGQAISLRLDFAEAFYNRGNLLMSMRRYDEAVSDYNRALLIKPGYTEVYQNLASIHMQKKHFVEAIANYDKAADGAAGARFLRGMRRHALMNICDWRNFDEDILLLAKEIDAGMEASPPLPILALIDSAAVQQRAAQLWATSHFPESGSIAKNPHPAPHKKIRLAYFSGDFHNHPVSILIAGVIEVHDRSKYEVYAFSFGPNTQDGLRKRLERAFDQFIDVREKSDQEVAQLARDLNVDIAVDLGGYTGDSRSAIFAERAAPTQVSFLGYPGTLGADFMDYLIGDRTVVPNALVDRYSEKIIYLPDCFLPNDSSRKVSSSVFNRKELHLPESGFVFCCFNNHYKITPKIFDGWMRILRSSENSVLWLSENSPTSAKNLRREAQRRGVDGERLVFAHRMPELSEHLARHRVADLFLDTLPYNAHATAIDALWAGLPIVTRIGEGFPGRVAASLLNAIGLPELITSSAEEYEKLAIELATNRGYLAQVRSKLERNRTTSRLFDTRVFTRSLENAYERIFERQQRGLRPDHIVIASDC